MSGHKHIIEQTDSQVDVTDDVECYENGKTFECDCGLGHGLKHSTKATKCPRCNRTCIDREASEREAPKTNKQQTTLGQW